MSLRHRVTGLSLAIVLLMSATPVAARSAPALRVTLDGRAISARSVGHWHCHDLEPSRIRCYRSRATLERAVRRYLARNAMIADRANLQDSGLAYVRVFEDASYGGASALLSQAYPNLGTIGWNDRITSFKVVNGGSGVFRWDALPQGGASYSFCCASQVSNIGATWNDKISAVTGNA